MLFRLGTGTGTFGTFYFDWELELELLELFNPNQELELERNFLGRFGTGTGTGTFIFFGTLGTLARVHASMPAAAADAAGTCCSLCYGTLPAYKIFRTSNIKIYLSLPKH